MDITDVVRAKRRCETYAWVGYYIGGALLLPALLLVSYNPLSPLFLLLVAALIPSSFSVLRGRPVGAGINTVLVGTVLSLTAYAIYGSPFFGSSLQLLVLWLLIILVGIALSLLGLRAAIVYQRLLPRDVCEKLAFSSLAERLVRKTQFLLSGRLLAIIANGLLCVACFLPFIAPLIGVLASDLPELQYIPHSVPFWIVYFLLVPLTGMGALYFWSRTKQAAAIRAQELREHDRRRPVLLLRSFQDDLTPIARKLPFTDLQPTFFYSRAWSLEEAMEKVLSTYGPVVAIGRPGEKMPPAGAAREYVSNEEWQARVREYISEAKLVVVILGKTPGLLWEYQQLADMEAWAKLVVVFPPVEETDLQSRWNLFILGSGTKPGPEVPAPSHRVLLATFSANRSLHFVTCEWRDDEECYQLALRSGLAARSPNQLKIETT